MPRSCMNEGQLGQVISPAASTTGTSVTVRDLLPQCRHGSSFLNRGATEAGEHYRWWSSTLCVS